MSPARQNRLRPTVATLTVAAGLCAIAGALSPAAIDAQGRGGAEWTTQSGDAQRTSWIRNDAKISVDSLRKDGNFKFLWKLTLPNEPRQLNALTQPVLLDRLIGYRGFKSIAFVGSSDETVYAIDTDFGTQLWRVHVNYSASPPPIVSGTLECPGGLTAALTRPTPLAPAAAGVGGGGFGRGGRSGGGVGEAGRGAPSIATAGQGRGGGQAPGGPPTPTPGAAGGLVPGSAAAAVAAARGGGGGRGAAPGAPDAAYVVASDGYVHGLNVQNGWDIMPPALFLPANTRASGLILVNDETSGMVYTSTTHGCGSTDDSVWAIDLVKAERPVTSWKAGGARIVGAPTLGRDGTIYVATAAGKAALSNSIVALEPKTLKQKAQVVIPDANFGGSPIVFPVKDKEILAVAGAGKISLLDAAALSGAPLATSAPYGSGAAHASSLATWQDAQAVRWILVTSPGPAPSGFASNGQVASGSIVAFKVLDQDGKLSIQPGWVSRDLVAPLTPLVVNGVVFAASSGEFQTTDAKVSAADRIRQSKPAVLYALEGTSGRELWNSGTSIGSFARAGLSGGAGVVYVTTYDSTVYAFGVPIEK